MKKNNYFLKLILFLSIIMVSVFLKDASQVKAANKKNDKYEYQVKNDEVIIVKYIGNEENILVPSKIDGYPVTTIKEMAFDDLEVKTIYFPYTVTKFKGTPIWSCNKLTGVIVGSGVKQIDDDLTALCDNIRYIVLGKNTVKVNGDVLYSSGDKKMFLSVPNVNAEGYGHWNSSTKVTIACDENSLLLDSLLLDSSYFGYPKKYVNTTDNFVNITFMDGDKVKAVANRVLEGTVVEQLFSLNNTSKRQFIGWYTSKDFKEKVDKISNASGEDITLYARYEDILTAPEVNVKKVNNKSYKISWNKQKGYYYQVELCYATYRGESYKVVQKYKQNIGEYTASVNGKYDCIFRVRAYKILDGVKLYSSYSKESYSSKPSYPSIYVSYYSLDMNYVGGVDNSIYFVNNSSKKIKYITFTVTGYNPVDDKVSDDISGKTSFQLRMVGPVNGNSLAGTTWEAAWYNSTTDYAKITKAKIEYMDGTTKTVDLNIKGNF